MILALIGWWPLNEDANDKSIYKNDGTVNGPTLTDGGPLGKCYEFDGIDDTIYFGNGNTFLPMPNFSISIWFKSLGTVDPTGTQPGIFGFTYGIRLQVYGDYLRFALDNGSTAVYLSSPATYDFYNDNKWHHVVAVATATEMRLYIDGELVKTGSVSWLGETRWLTNSWNLGRDNNNYYCYFKGYMSDLRIYNHALSLKEIKDLAKCKVLHYTFNQFQEPTTNIFPRSSDELAFVNAYNGTNYGFGSGTDLQQNLTTDYMGMSATKVSRITGGTSQRDYVGVFLSSPLNSTRVVSFWYYGTYGTQIRPYNNDLCANLYYLNSSNEWIGGTTGVNIPVEENIWQKITIKIENRGSAAGTGWTWLILHNNSVTTTLSNSEFWMFSQFMFEEKDHPTTFVNGSRTGNVYDCSGFNNNSNLNESTTPKWVEGGPIGSGYYEFKQNQKIEISNILNTKFTVSFWMKSVSDKVKHVIGNANGFFSNGGGWFIGCASSAADMYFEVQSSDSRTPIRFYSNRVFDWSHFVAVYNEGEMKTYLNGNLQSSGFRVMNSTSNDIILGDKNISTYYMDGDLITDIRFYATDLSEDTIKEIYQSRASIDNNKNVYVNKIKEDKYVDAILDYSTWTIGTTGSQTGFSRNGLESENYIIEGKDPFGNIIPIWEARPDATSGADGGWNSDLFSIDNTKYYRFSTWVKRTVKGNGHFYLGTEGYNSANADIGVLYRSTGAVNTNPYFNVNSNWGEWESGVENKWYLVVGHIFPVNSGTGYNHPDSGVYDINGNKIKDAEADFVWQTDVVKSRHRSYLYYSTDTSTRQQWCYPRVDVCDGSEPTISDLINGVDYEHYKILNGEESSGSFRKTGIIKVNEINTVGPTNGLILYMPLNGDTKDYSGNSNDGTNNGATVVQGLGNKLAYSFDGVDDYILINNGIFYDLNINAFTLHFVYKRLGTSTAECLLCSRTSLGYGVSVFLLNDGYIRFDTADDSDIYQWATGIQISDNQEVIIDCVYTPGNKYLYINGELNASTSIAPDSLGYLSENYTTIGMSQIDNTSYGNPLGGRLQDIRIYNRALSQQEISWLYDMYNPNKSIGAKIFNNNIIYAHSFKEGY